MFSEIFGDSPKAKLLDFLGDHPTFDYNISALAEYTNISRPTLYKIIPELLSQKILIETRKVGRSKMYKLHTENKLVQHILRFDFEIADIIAEEESKQDASYGHRPVKSTACKPEIA